LPATSAGKFVFASPLLGQLFAAEAPGGPPVAGGEFRPTPPKILQFRQAENLTPAWKQFRENPEKNRLFLAQTLPPES
jgi:hypothetical protein